MSSDVGVHAETELEVADHIADVRDQMHLKMFARSYQTGENSLTSYKFDSIIQILKAKTLLKIKNYFL